MGRGASGASASHVLGFMVVAALVGGAGPVWAAAEIVVTSGADAGPGTLREALAQAVDGDQITFSTRLSEVTLTSAELVIDENVTIAGPGAKQMVVSRRSDAKDEFRIFRVEPSVTATVSGLTISGGVTFQSGPSSGIGGGVLIRPSARVTINDCVIAGNQAVVGGGLFAEPGATLTISHTSVSGNTARVSGGGLVAWQGFLVVDASTFSGNTAASGGGAHVEGPAQAWFGNSTFSDNEATATTIEGGDAVFVNVAPTRVPPTFPLTTVHLEAVTLTGGDGALVRISEHGMLSYRNTIFAATGGAATVVTSGLATAVSRGYNLFSDGGGAVMQTDWVHIDPLLAPLKGNGGPTMTHALQAGSPAIDRGSCTDATGAAILVDQRGSPRPETGCDAGAFEGQEAPPSDEHAEVLDAIADLRSRLESSVAPLASQQSVADLGSGLGASMAALSHQLTAGLAPLATQTSLDKTHGLVSGRLDETVTSRASQRSLDVWQEREARTAIERQLADGGRLLAFVLPKALGGRIEDVQAVAWSALERATAASFKVGTVKAILLKGDNQLASRNYNAAWNAYSEAYRFLVGR